MKNSKPINSSIDNYTIIMYSAIAFAILYLLMNRNENFEDSSDNFNPDNYYSQDPNNPNNYICDSTQNSIEKKAAKKFTNPKYINNTKKFCPLPEDNEDEDNEDEPDTVTPTAGIKPVTTKAAAKAAAKATIAPVSKVTLSPSTVTLAPASTFTLAPASTFTLAPASSITFSSNTTPDINLDDLNNLPLDAFDDSDDGPDDSSD